MGQVEGIYLFIIMIEGGGFQMFLLHSSQFSCLPLRKCLQHAKFSQ
jgi:hypothetical protein